MKFKKGYRKVNDKDRLFYFERSFFTLDGLWMIEVEKETGWDTALSIDLEVWKKLIKIVIRRIKEYLKIQTNTLQDLINILTFRWSIESWDYEVTENEEGEAYIEINHCPYKSIMDRNPERQDKAPLICREMCIPFYKAIVEDFNPNINIERKYCMGYGNKHCDFHFKIKENLNSINGKK
jgi:hypothetical protein